MRDLLNDLDAGRTHAGDPMKSAREAMKPVQPRRFYTAVSVADGEGGYEIHLDGKPARTPGRQVLRLPTKAAAELVAAEFDKQGETMDLHSMSAMRLANTAIDGVASDPQAVAEDILRYAGTDLLCYRADAPQELVARQAERWDPLIDWAADEIGANFILAEGVMHVEQPRSAIAAVDAWLRQRREPLRLAALHVMTSLSGSAIIALAVDAKRLSAVNAWALAHLDEEWNAEQWGRDPEAEAMRANRWRDMNAAAMVAAAL
jgi:chaperone required for assembly of F1-ATPase